MSTVAAVDLLIQLRDEASAALGAIGGNLNNLGRQAEQQQGMFGRLFGVVAGAGVAAFAGMAVGAAGAATAGFSLNNAMEMTSAKINAFTKDGAATADILAMIQERASKTPFEFQAMADAAAALIPVSKASGVGLEDLIAKAEILAASNPAEGLEGAAFALKEAVSGDFTSVIERFNLPKQYLNELKSQGVPAAEAVSMAMQQLGLDSDLVSNLAETASGRWSTFKDTLQGLAATVTKPIFTMFSAGLGQVNGLLEAAAPTLTAVATSIGEGLASGIQSAAGFFYDLWAAAQPTIELLYNVGAAISAFVSGTGDLGTVADFLSDLFGGVIGAGIANFIGMITAAGSAIFRFATGASGLMGLAISLMTIFGPTIGVLIAEAIGVLMSYAQVWIDLGATIFNVVSALMSGDLAGAWAALTSGIAQVVADYQIYAASLASLLWGLATTIGQAVLTWGAALVDWIAPYIPIALAYLQTFAAQIWAWIVAQAPILYQQVLTWGQAFVDWISPYISLALTALGGFIASIWAWIVEQAPGIAAQVMAWGQAFVDWIAPYIPIALTYLQTFAASVWAWIVEQAPILYQQVLTWGQAFVDWITPYVSLALTALGGFISAVWAWIVEQAPILYAQVLTWGQAFVDWITPYIPIALAYLQTFAASVWAWIVEQAPILYQQVLTWGAAFVDWITPYISLALTALGGFISAVWAWIVEQAPGILDKVMAWGQSLVEWVAPQIPVVLGALGEMASSFFDWISEQAGPILEKLGVWAAALVEWIVPATVDFLAAWPGMLSSFLDWIANAVGPIAAGLVDWALEMVAWVAPMIPDLLVAIAGIAAALLTFIAETAIVLVPKVIAWAGAFLGWVATDVLPKIAGVLGDILTRIEEWIGTAVDWIVDKAVSLGQAMIDGAVKGIEDAGSALLDTMSNMADDALNAAKKALGIASPSKVMAQEVGAPIVDGIVAGLVQRSPKAVQAMLDLASSMFDVVSKGVEAFGKLRELGSVPQSAILNFSDAIQRTLTEFANRVGQWDKAAMSAASQFTFKAGQVVDFLAKGVELLSSIASMAVPSQGAIRVFADSLAMVMSEIVRVSTFELRLGLTAGVEFASGAKAIAEMVGKGVEALNALADFVRPAPGMIQQFADVIYWLVSRFVQVGGWFDGQALGAAQVFATAASQVFDVVSGGVDALLKLAEFVRPAPGVIQQFADVLYWLISRFVIVGQWFTGPALAAASTFAEAAGKVVGVIGAAVDGLLKLGEFVRPAPGVIQTFTDVIWWLVSRFAEAASWMTSKALAAAVAFADGAGKSVGVIGAAVDALGKLSTFVAPLEENVSAFFRSLADFLEKMGSWSANFEADMLAATGAFAEGIGKSVAGLGAAVDVLGKLVNFVAPAEANVSAFLRGMADMLEKMGSMAYYFEADMLAATAALADGIGKSVAGLGAAVDLLSKLVDFVAPAEANVSAFLRGLADLLEKMGSMAYYFEEDMLAVTGALSAGIGKSVAGLGAAVDALGKLVGFVAPAEDGVSAFFRSLADLLEKMGVWSANFEADMLEATAAFAAGIQKSVAGIGAAADALGKLVDFVAPAEANVSAFFRSLADLLEKMGVWSANFEADMLEATAAFAAGINQAVAPLKGAIESLGKFVDFVPPAQKGVSAFFQSVGALLTQMGQLAGQYSAEFFAGTILFGQNVSKAVAIVKASFDQFAGLADLKGLAAGVLTNFSNNLARLLDELGALVAPAAENIGAALVYGIADGITAQLPYLVATLQNAAYTMVDTVNSALGIASPSKVFEQIGQYAGEGMAGGMAAMQPAIAGAGAGLGMAAAGGASGAASSGRGGGGGDITITIANMNVPAGRGPLTERELRQLAQLIKEEIANERGGR